MTTRTRLATLVALLAPLGGRVPAQNHAAPHWEYEGTHGPANWGTLDKAYATCLVGKLQSPIDIRHVQAAPLPAITFSYKPSPLKLIDNGHTIQVTYAPGSFITWGNERYELVQFHFHHPAEERVFGKSYPLVVHLVHKNAAGKLAVVAVLVEEGEGSIFLDQLFRYLPAEQGKEVAPDKVQVDASALLPDTRAYYTFTGSLTTPPCTEDVTWFVLKTAVEASKEEIDAFAAKYPHNARPVQPVNGRVIQETN